MNRSIAVSSLIFCVLSATTIHVPDDYTTIQAGINASNDGDTVLVAQGTYVENLVLEVEIVLASHAINDDLTDWMNNENIQNTKIIGNEPSDPKKGRRSRWHLPLPRPRLAPLKSPPAPDSRRSRMRLMPAPPPAPRRYAAPHAAASVGSVLPRSVIGYWLRIGMALSPRPERPIRILVF